MKLNKYFLILNSFFLVSNFTFCQKEATITGNFAGASENDIVYIESNKGIKDSTHISNNQFRFVINPGELWDVYFIKCPGMSQTYIFPLFLHGGSYIRFDINKELDNPKISGDENAEEQNRFYQGYNSITKNYSIIQKQISTEKDSAKLFLLNQQLRNAEAQSTNYPIDWVVKHKKSPFSVVVIRLFIYKGIQQGEDTVAERYFDSLLPQAIENNYQSYILTQSFAIYNDKYSKIPNNGIAPNFSVEDTSGKEIKLNDFRNQYLLIDFWASWCGPCRENNPLLKQLYYKYKEKGLNVLSISVDTNAAKWKAAIKKDEMDWPQGSDLSGQNNGVGLKYQIGAVPQYILIAPDRTIVLKSIGGDIKLVESKLKDLLK